MVNVKELQVRYREDSMAISLTEDMLLGEYDVQEGKDFYFYLHNPNDSIRAGVSKLHATHDEMTFYPPESGWIEPLQTVKVLLRIKPRNIPDLESFQRIQKQIELEDLPKPFGKIDGKIRWEYADNAIISQ